MTRPRATRDRHSRNRHQPSLSSNKPPAGRSATPARLRFRFPPFLEITLRWSVLLMILLALFGSVAARRLAWEDADAVSIERQKLERVLSERENELERFLNPEYRENYLKSRRMRHEPGEQYIDFQEP